MCIFRCNIIRFYFCIHKYFWKNVNMQYKNKEIVNTINEQLELSESDDDSDDKSNEFNDESNE